MREFTNKENEIVKKLVDTLRDTNRKSLAELQVARLLREDLKFFALKWSVEPKDEVTIYTRKEDANQQEIIDKLYFNIADYIYFIEELEDLGFIKLQNIPTDNEDNYTILYDRKKYQYDETNNNFWQEVKDLKIGDRTISGVLLVPLKGWQKINTDFAKDLQRCALSIVYPLPLAKAYVDNGFNTDEQLSLKKQLKDTKESLCWAKRTFWITLGALIITVLLNKFGSQSINEEQINNLVESIGAKIEDNHLEEPLLISTADTIKVLTIDTAAKIKK